MWWFLAVFDRFYHMKSKPGSETRWKRPTAKRTPVLRTQNLIIFDDFWPLVPYQIWLAFLVVFGGFPNSTDWWNYWKNICDSEIFHQIFAGFYDSVTFFIFCVFDGFPNSTDWWNYWKNICDSEIFHQFFAGFYNSGTFFIFCVFDGFPNSTDWSNYWKNLCDSEIFHQFFAGFYNSDTFFIFLCFWWFSQ